jgi:siroheme synthase-like protein
MGRYYPVYLDVQGRHCVVVGAGVIAERKVEQLLSSDAKVTFVSPEATDAIRGWTTEGRVTWVKRAYQPGDLAGTFLAIAATDDESVNRQVHAEAEAERVLLNVVDVPPLCSFIAPAVVERGKVTVAISTAGSSPALARRLREMMEGSRPVNCPSGEQANCRCLAWADAADLLAEVRMELRTGNHKVDPEAWQEAMDDDLLALVEQGAHEQARKRLLHTLLRAADIKKG